MRAMTGLCLCGSALLSAPLAAAPHGMTYDCDTAAGHFSELNLRAENGPFTVTGKVRLNAVAESSTYVPLVRIQIAETVDQGQVPKTFAGFSLAALPLDPAKADGAKTAQALSYNANGIGEEIIPGSLTAKPGSVQTFRLTFTGTAVVVGLGPNTKTFPMKSDNPSLRVVCSTGEFLLTDVIVRPGQQ